MNKNQKGFANIALVVVIVILVGAVGYFVLVRKLEPIAQQPTPTPTQTKTSISSAPSTLESQIQLAVSQVLAGPAITGYQPIPKGSKLLSTKVVISNNIPTITLNFNKAIIANGQATFEDTFSLVSNTIHPIVQGQGKDPKYAELQFVTLIEGKPLNEVLK